jgi:pSer/pThr/pTyr-binding forkhead associated (FHA) protein
MNPATISLTVVKGPQVGQEYELDRPAVYVVGRAEECYPRVPDNDYFRDISRHHCMISVNPPELWVQDLGSKNGTYVNGRKIGQRVNVETEDGTAPVVASGREQLKDGDEVSLGSNTVLRVGVRILEEAAV